MTEYAHVDGDTITLGRPPDSIRLPDGTVITGLRGATAATLAEHGWWPVVRVDAELGDQENHGPPVLSFDGTTVTAHRAAVPWTPEQHAAAAHTQTLRSLVDGAPQVRDRLTDIADTLTAQGQELAAARATITHRLTEVAAQTAGLPTPPNATQIRAALVALSTVITHDLGQYLAAENDALITAGTAIRDIAQADADTVKALSNNFARELGVYDAVIDGAEVRPR